MRHLIFYDAGCPLCRKSIERVGRIDRHHLFTFVPLEQMKGPLAPYRREDSLVLVEQDERGKQRVWLRGRAVFRIFWLIGGKWRLLGWLAYCPFGVDALYRLIARHRNKL